MTRFARALPRLREQVESDLEDTDALTRERVPACAVRLLDRGFFRIGTEEYAVSNESFGLATMRKQHVTIEPGGVMAITRAKASPLSSGPTAAGCRGRRDRPAPQGP